MYLAGLTALLPHIGMVDFLNAVSTMQNSDAQVLMRVQHDLRLSGSSHAQSAHTSPEASRLERMLKQTTSMVNELGLQGDQQLLDITVAKAQEVRGLWSTSLQEYSILIELLALRVVPHYATML